MFYHGGCHLSNILLHRPWRLLAFRTHNYFGPVAFAIPALATGCRRDENVPGILSLVQRQMEEHSRPPGNSGTKLGRPNGIIALGDMQSWPRLASHPTASRCGLARGIAAASARARPRQLFPGPSQGRQIRQCRSSKFPRLGGYCGKCNRKYRHGTPATLRLKSKCPSGAKTFVAMLGH